MKKIAILLIVLAGIFNTPVAAEELTLAWRYNRYFFNQLVGFKLFMSKGAGLPATLIADIPKANVTITDEKPILLKEHFDVAPGNKYEVTGAWAWVPETKNMKISGPDFMVAFTVAAGTDNDMFFTFWPEKSSSDRATIYSYLKDDGAHGVSYYELRLADAAGTRFSNWRKVVNSAFGGVEGAFALPRYNQCEVQSTGNTLCPGFRVDMLWGPGHYEAIVFDKSVFGADETPLNIQRLEVIAANQGGWIDDIVVGGRMEVHYKATVALTPDEEVFFTATAYRKDPADSSKILESLPSAEARYAITQEPVKRAPPPAKNMRKLPDGS
jgi:hypothetical protein